VDPVNAAALPIPESATTDNGTPESEPVAHVEDLKIALQFIKALQNATLDNDELPGDVRERLRHAIQEPLDTDDPYLRLSIDLFLSVSNASQDTYTSVRKAITRCFPEAEILSYDQVKRKIAEISGIVPLVHDMCVNSCIGYTGPFFALEACPKCGEPRFDPIRLASSNGRDKISRQSFSTIPLGPQLQALWRTPEGAAKMRYRQELTKKIRAHLHQSNGSMDVYEDFFYGRDYLDAVEQGRIRDEDVVLLFSIDGAQLYRNKQSDCWIYIWVILDHAPDVRYKKKYVLPGGFIPGPNKPKNVDSFLFPGIHHLSALQNDGLSIWDAGRNEVFVSQPFFALATADGPGMTYLDGLVGHSGAYGCRLYCPLKGRHKPGGGHYYPALLKPHGYDVEGCDHVDVDAAHLPGTSASEYSDNLQYVQQSINETQYKKRRKDTGISKPSIFSGLQPERTLGVPSCFPADLMHLVSLNLTDLFLSLWRGTMLCEKTDDKSLWDWFVLQGDVWKVHGNTVASSTPYLPGSFDRPPRNPAEKISSGYKAWEYLLYVFALGPGLFYGVLPDEYWRHFCKLVMAIRILHQRRIPVTQLRTAHVLFVEFEKEFESRYYQQRADRLHFCRQSVHALLHLAPEVTRVGPPVYYTQWTMERTIGNLGEEIKQPSNPYANLSQRGLRRSQVNALKAMIPDIDPDETSLPRGAQDLGDGFVLLRAKDQTARLLGGPEAAAIRSYFCDTVTGIPPGWQPRITRWARLRLPNGQVARSVWKEKLKPLEAVRMARNVKVQFSTATALHPF
jgi:hypothetical protein